MRNAVTRKFELFAPLPETDRQLLDDVVSRARTLGADQDIVREGDDSSDVHLVLDGLCCRYKTLSNGDRQNLAFLIPGDFCDLHVFILKTMDHNIATVTKSAIVDVPRARIIEMMARPALARAMWWSTLVDEAIFREWLMNLGVRDANHRIAHLLCELHTRMQGVGLVTDGFALPLTQVELGQTLGMSHVHMNRSLQKLRAMGMIEARFRRIVVLDIDALRRFCDFNATYLHFEGGAPEAPRCDPLEA